MTEDLTLVPRAALERLEADVQRLKQEIADLKTIVSALIERVANPGSAPDDPLNQAFRGFLARVRERL